MDQQKECCSCRQSTCFANFSRDKTKKDGMSSTCKGCSKRRSTEWRAENIELIKVKDAARYKENAERKKAAARNYHNNNKQRISESKSRKYKASGGWAKKTESQRKDALKVNSRCRERLTPGYVAQALGMTVKTAPKDLIDMKREQLAMRRLARQLKEKLHESSTNTD